MTELEAKVEVNRTEKECGAEFTPTRAELLVLVKHYHERCLIEDYFTFHTGEVLSDRRGHAYASERIKRIEEVLGVEDVREAIFKAEKDFREKFTVDPLKWRIFKDGDREQ
jgi:hypothetical protein